MVHESPLSLAQEIKMCARNTWYMRPLDTQWYDDNIVVLCTAVLAYVLGVRILCSAVYSVMIIDYMYMYLISPFLILTYPIAT